MLTRAIQIRPLLTCVLDVEHVARHCDPPRNGLLDERNTEPGVFRCNLAPQLVRLLVDDKDGRPVDAERLDHVVDNVFKDV